MSAITGIFYIDGRKIDPELIKKMNNRLSHRGPDGSAVWCEGSIALGHQMLWTTPESLHEKLPFEDEVSGLVITADARIDNRDELSKELDIEDKEEVSDSYFILKAYQMWGENCPDKLLGDFAFAIWDKNEEKLFCARDHMGVKPFYYYLDDEMFVFGTEIKALFCVSGVPRELNERRVAFYLMDIEDNKSTFYENIVSLSKAHSLTIKRDISKIKEYWKLDPDSQMVMESEEDYIKSFRKIFENAVKCRLRSAYPLGFELSGGLDSSSVVCMSKEILNENKNSSLNTIKTFSQIFDDFPQCDERNYIQNIINTGKIEAHFIRGDNINPFHQIEMILWHQEQPFFTPNMVTLWNFYKKIHKENVRVVLGGSGGDVVISYGTNYLYDLAITFKWKQMIKELNYFSERVNVNFYYLFYIHVLLSLIPEHIKTFTRFFKKNSTYILNNLFSERIKAQDYLNKFYWKPLNEFKTAKKFHYYSLSMDNIYFLEMLDRTTSVFSIEPRYPFLDKRLVEFCYSLPSHMKFKFGWSRYILRKSMEGIIPKENQWRPFKSLIDSVFERNLLVGKEYIEKILFKENNIISNYVDINKLIDINQKVNRGNNSYDDYNYIWRSVLFGIWLKNERIVKSD
jgi:asparagine synthase (glutamine-hydrolysing)